MRNGKWASLGFALGLLSSTAVVQAQESLVNVNIQDILQDIAVDLNIEDTNIPVTLQVPVSIAANVCGVDVGVLSAQLDTGNANCTAQTGSQELTQIVQQEMNAGDAGSTGDTSGSGGTSGGTSDGSTGAESGGTGTSTGGTTTDSGSGTTDGTSGSGSGTGDGASEDTGTSGSNGTGSGSTSTDTGDDTTSNGTDGSGSSGGTETGSDEASEDETAEGCPTVGNANPNSARGCAPGQSGALPPGQSEQPAKQVAPGQVKTQ